MIYLNADTVFTWRGFKDSVTGQIVNDATVTGQLLDDEGIVASFAFTGLGNGVYVGTLPYTATAILTEGEEYLVEITATNGDAYDFRCEKHTAEYRGFA